MRSYLFSPAIKPLEVPVNTPSKDLMSKAMEAMLKKLDTSILLNQTIDLAVKEFKSGQAINEEFITEIKKDAELQKKLRTFFSPTYLEGGASFQYKDPDFPSYPSNKIAESNLIASVGPTHRNVARFFQNTVFNFKHAVKEIIALGYTISYSSKSNEEDFFDYFSKSSPSKEFNTSLSLDKTTSEVGYALISNNVSAGMKFTDSATECFPEDIIKAKLTLIDSETNDLNGNPVLLNLNVTLYPIKDGGWIDLNEKKSPLSLDRSTSSLEYRKSILWDLFKKTLTEPVLIHCKAGLGRTGHVILMFELLKHYNRIENSSTAQAKAKEIKKVLDRIRLNRPALVSSVEQFTAAIRNADSLYRYALEMKYIHSNEPVYESALKHTENKPATTAAKRFSLN